MGLRFTTWMIYLDLQVGVLYMASSYITLASAILAVNSKLLPGKNNWSLDNGVTLFALALMAIWLIAFLGAVWQTHGLILTALLFWFFYILLWLFVVFLSNFSEEYGRVKIKGSSHLTARFSTLCVDHRCPVSMWLYSNRLSKVLYEKFDYLYHMDHQPWFDTPVHDPFHDYNGLETFSDPIFTGSYKKESYETRFVLATVAFVFCFLTSLVLLITSWILLYSYYHEAKCIFLNTPCVKNCPEEPKNTPEVCTTREEKPCHCAENVYECFLCNKCT